MTRIAGTQTFGACEGNAIIRFDMVARGLKTNIAINLAAFLLLAMLLISFVMIIKAKRDLFQSEIAKGYLFINAIGNNLIKSSESGNYTSDVKFKDEINEILNEAGFPCIMILDNDNNKLYSGGTDCTLQDELERLTRATLQSGEKTTRFFGTTWGVFWKQSRNMIISAPLLFNGRILAGASIVLELEGIYKTLRHTQQLLFIYILINTVILTLIGVYRLSKIFLDPVYRLVKRAEDYQENEEIFFSARKEDNEFAKLSKALNRMLKRISEDKEKLQQTVRSLEKSNIHLKRAQKDIIRAEKLASVGRLSSGIAHEIGNPIGIVLGYLGLIKQKDITDHEKKEFIVRAENEINRINTIIRQLLDFSRISSDDLKNVSVHEIINDVIKVLKSQPLMSNIGLQLGLAAEKDTVVADPDQLRQVFLNLIINAADAIALNGSPGNGKLNITSEIVSGALAGLNDNQATLKIMFVDNGHGIPEEIISNIFDPFYTTKEPGKGTGLGLYVCFLIIEGIGGTIQAISEEGKGTTMTICLPLFFSDYLQDW
ncbi:MAG: hypothetical protein AUJ48_03605 [Deltaproteobacteria bacterium CG1_02_45_11]|nr:MAG: hypothetical protein AUJ48_03605 [Deltaproteobacteria bacterium CG1_02_45_11]